MIIRVVIILENFVVARLLLLRRSVLGLLGRHCLVAGDVRVLGLLARARQARLLNLSNSSSSLVHLLNRGASALLPKLTIFRVAHGRATRRQVRT